MDRKKVYVYSVVGLLILITGIFVVNAVLDLNSPWHSAEEIVITLNGFDITLQQAADEGFLTAGTTSVPDHNYVIAPLIRGHPAGNILIQVGGYTMTLQEAIDYNVLTVGAATSYSTAILGTGHTFSSLDQIVINVGGSEMTLQTAINNEEFCNPTYGSNCGGDICINPGTFSCDGTCIGTSYKPTGTICGTYMQCDATGNCIQVCVPTYGNSCGGDVCINPGTVACDGTCVGTSYKPAGTVCGEYMQCDATGNCVLGCVPQTETACYDNDVYWFDSCGAMEEKKEECGEDYCGGWFPWGNCLPYIKIREWRRACYSQGCSDSSCYSIFEYYDITYKRC